MQLELKVINQVLLEAKDLRLNDSRTPTFYGLKTNWTFLKSSKDEDWGREDQGNVSEMQCVFKVEGLPENLFVEVNFFSDSYGEVDDYNTVKFVEGKLVQTLAYQPI